MKSFLCPVPIPIDIYSGISHDDLLENMGLSGRTFTQKHSDKVVEMTRLLLDYMKTVRQRVSEEVSPDPDSAAIEEPEPPAFEIKMTEHGYPVLPDLIMKTELSKSQCEELLRGYLSQHYCKFILVIPGANSHPNADLASNKKNRRVPYAAINVDTQAFVSSGCLPSGVNLKDPRQMHRDVIQSILRHCLRRQQESGPESAFRFLMFTGPKRKRMFAEYPDPNKRPQVQSQTAKKKGRQTVKPKKKGKQTEVSQLDDLLTISQNMSLNPSRNASPDRTRTMTDKLVTIDMGKMMMLRDMGHEVIGPINGPNEGLPLYEVPRSWLEQLELQINDGPNPSPFPTPTPHLPVSHRHLPVIDPSLISGPSNVNQTNQVDANPNTTPGSGLRSDEIPAFDSQNLLEQTLVQEQQSGSESELAASPASRETSTVLEKRTSTPPPKKYQTRSTQKRKVTTPESGVHEEQSGSESELAASRETRTVLGKRSTLMRSPPKKHQTRSTQKRKVTTDDLAMLEARELLKGAAGKRTRRTRRRG